MKKIYSLLLVAVFFTACSKNEDPQPIANDYLISAEKSSEIGKLSLQTGLSAYPAYAQYADKPQTDVSLYRVSYNTEYPKGTAIRASGVFVVPADYDTDLPTVIYTHGSIYKEEAPSGIVGNPLSYSTELLLGAVLSSSFKCAVLVPDYIGYGDSETVPHPYIHAESLGQASLDIIRAFKEYAKNPDIGLEFNKRIFITGYSEGGCAAVALQKKIQETTDADLQIDKTVAGSGVYDNVTFAKGFLAIATALDPHVVSSYLWALATYKIDFAYSKSYEYMFSAADNVLLQGINYNTAYFAAESLGINTNPSLLFRPEFRNGVLNGSDTEFTQILKDNSLTDFLPHDSLIFVCGSADTWVYPLNSHNAYNAMKAKGCKVKLYEHPGGTHASTLPVYLDAVLNRLSVY